MYGNNTGRIYDPEKDYWDAMEQLDALKSNLPQYEDKYGQSLQELYREITQRPKFSYDPNDDALYQNYKNSYAQQGRLAMEDAMGQAAGLTGGYGSTYSQAVGQQQYDAYLQKLNDIYPELYSMAYNHYLDEGNAMLQQYELLSGMADDDYKKYQDQLEAHYREMDILLGRAETAYDRQYAADQDAYNRSQDELKHQNDAYDRLAKMITTTGYVPTEEELLAAGMSKEHMEAYLGYYNAENAGSRGGGGGKNKEEESVYDTVKAQAEKRLAKGVSLEDVNSEILRKVTRGELDAETARELMAALTQEYHS